MRLLKEFASAVKNKNCYYIVPFANIADIIYSEDARNYKGVIEITGKDLYKIYDVLLTIIEESEDGDSTT
jgi:hypothetical protein